MNEPVIATAVFDPKVKVYWYFQGLFAHFMLIFAVVGLFTLPVWAIFGLVIVGKRYDALSAQLTDRSVHLRSGVFFKVEMTIPLEKIQDLSLRTGPLLNTFGLASLQIDTAGGNAQHSADMMLPGLSNAEAFRNAVLAQRDRRTGVPDVDATGGDSTRAVLEEIRDSLLRLEALVAARG
jgi:membrane protein YdbS with pleckstrin-like domain